MNKSNQQNFRDGDTITIEGKKYVIASVKGGGFTLLDASENPTHMNKNTQQNETFSEDYPRFICTADLNPDGLFWKVWDRFNNVQITTGFEHRIVRPYCDHLNKTWGAQQSPQFNAHNPKA